MPLFIRASTPEQTLNFIVDLIRAEQQKFTDKEAEVATLVAKKTYRDRAAACDHIVTMLSDVIIDSLDGC